MTDPSVIPSSAAMAAKGTALRPPVRVGNRWDTRADFPAAIRRDRGQAVAVQEGEEGALDEVGGLAGRMSLATDEGVEGISVGRAQLGQGVAGRGAGAITGDDLAPSRRRERGIR